MFDSSRLHKFLSIAEATPPESRQPAVGEIPRDWATRMGVSERICKIVPEVRCDRRRVFEFCQADTDLTAAYVMSMAWGWQRDRNAKIALRHIDKIEQVLSRLRHESLSCTQCYELFTGFGKIPGLGPSYFTKLIYFFSRSVRGYVMDQWTSLSVNYLANRVVVRLSTPLKSGGMVSPTTANTGENYQRFCFAIDALAEVIERELGRRCDGDSVEQLLFSHGKVSPERKRQEAGLWRQILIDAHSRGSIPLRS